MPSLSATMLTAVRVVSEALESADAKAFLADPEDLVARPEAPYPLVAGTC